MALKAKNEKDIKDRYKTISSLIPDHSKNEIAQYIAQKIMIRRRDMITKLTMDDIKAEVSSIEKITMLFGDQSPFQFKAKMDQKFIEVYMLR